MRVLPSRQTVSVTVSPGLVAAEAAQEVAGALHGLAVDLLDDVAGDDPRRPGRPSSLAARPRRRRAPADDLPDERALDPEPARDVGAQTGRRGRRRARGASTRPCAISSGTMRLTVSTGTAKPMPALAPEGL